MPSDAGRPSGRVRPNPARSTAVTRRAEPRRELRPDRQPVGGAPAEPVDEQHGRPGPAAGSAAPPPSHSSVWTNRPSASTHRSWPATRVHHPRRLGQHAGMPDLETSDGVRLHWEASGSPACARRCSCSTASAPTRSRSTALAAAVGDRLHLVRLDLRGHGRSEPLTDPARYGWFDRAAADVVELLDVLGWDRPVVVGGSLGAAVADRDRARAAGARRAARAPRPGDRRRSRPREPRRARVHAGRAGLRARRPARAARRRDARPARSRVARAGASQLRPSGRRGDACVLRRARRGGARRRPRPAHRRSRSPRSSSVGAAIRSTRSRWPRPTRRRLPDCRLVEDADAAPFDQRPGDLADLLVGFADVVSRR